MNILTTRNFNGVALDCYKVDGDDDDFWATREQIGRLLGYKNPRIAVTNIHDRNADRLNKFSTVLKMSTVEGNRTVTRDVTVYNFRGLLEICRWSNQPKANDVMDFLWDIAEDVRKHGMYLNEKAREAALVDPETFNAVARAYAQEKEKVKALQAEIDKNAGYLVLGKVVSQLPGYMTPTEASDFIYQNTGKKMGRNTLYKYGRNKEWLSKQKQHWNKPTQKGLKTGFASIALDTDEFKLGTRTMLNIKAMETICREIFHDVFPLLAPLLDEYEQEAV